MRRETLQVLLPGPAPGALIRRRKVPPPYAGRGNVGLAAEVSGAASPAGEALSMLGRWESHRSPGCGRRPVPRRRAPVAGPGVGVLGRRGTRFCGASENLSRVRVGRLGAPGPVEERGFRRAPALPPSLVMAVCWARGGKHLYDERVDRTYLGSPLSARAWRGGCRPLLVNVRIRRQLLENEEGVRLSPEPGAWSSFGRGRVITTGEDVYP